MVRLVLRGDVMHTAAAGCGADDPPSAMQRVSARLKGYLLLDEWNWGA